MEQVRTTEIHTGSDRRMGGTSIYAGPKRRSLKYRRDADFIVCIYCKQACDSYGMWGKHASSLRSIDQCRAGICPDCSSRRLSHFYSSQ